MISFVVIFFLVLGIRDFSFSLRLALFFERFVMEFYLTYIVEIKRVIAVDD